MQAAGRSEGRCYIWSNIKDTSGLTTIDNPFKIIEDKRYVKLFPEAVYETNNVDLPYKIFKMVSYCPYLKLVNPNKSWISFSNFSF
jgi:hypothetical protein